jgi:hypothetical protein
MMARDAERGAALAGLIAALVRYAERPKNASDWQLRFQVQLLLPTFQ